MSFNAPEQHISTKGYISQIHNDEGDEPNVIMKKFTEILHNCLDQLKLLEELGYLLEKKFIKIKLFQKLRGEHTTFHLSIQDNFTGGNKEHLDDMLNALSPSKASSTKQGRYHAGFISSHAIFTQGGRYTTTLIAKDRHRNSYDHDEDNLFEAALLPEGRINPPREVTSKNRRYWNEVRGEEKNEPGMFIEFEMPKSTFDKIKEMINSNYPKNNICLMISHHFGEIIKKMSISLEIEVNDQIFDLSKPVDFLSDSLCEEVTKIPVWVEPGEIDRETGNYISINGKPSFEETSPSCRHIKAAEVVVTTNRFNEKKIQENIVSEMRSDYQEHIENIEDRTCKHGTHVHICQPESIISCPVMDITHERIPKSSIKSKLFDNFTILVSNDQSSDIKRFGCRNTLSKCSQEAHNSITNITYENVEDQSLLDHVLGTKSDKTTNTESKLTPLREKIKDITKKQLHTIHKKYCKNGVCTDGRSNWSHDLHSRLEETIDEFSDQRGINKLVKDFFTKYEHRVGLDKLEQNWEETLIEIIYNKQLELHQVAEDDSEDDSSSVSNELEMEVIEDEDSGSSRENVTLVVSEQSSGNESDHTSSNEDEEDDDRMGDTQVSRSANTARYLDYEQFQKDSSKIQAIIDSKNEEENVRNLLIDALHAYNLNEPKWKLEMNLNCVTKPTNNDLFDLFKKYVEKDDKKPQQDIKGGSKMRSIMSISI